VKSQNLHTSGRLFDFESELLSCHTAGSCELLEIKGAARRIVKDKGSGLIKPIETTEKELISAKNWKDSDAAKQRSPGMCRDKTQADG